VNRALWLLPITLVTACVLANADTGIKTVVKVVETRYAVRHHGIPGLWLARPFLTGSGIGGLRMAEFAKFHVPPQDSYSLKENLAHSLGPEWQSFVEVWSKNDGEWTVIYTRATNEGLSLLIVESERDDTFTVVQVNLNGKALRQWVDEPIKSARHEPDALAHIDMHVQ
jgi:hypothetical protein